jgi:diacylglycerol kinase
MKAFKHFLKSLGFASRGLQKAWHDESSFRGEVFAAFIVILAALLLRISLTALAVIVMTSFFVISLELINTMVESMSDMLKPRLDQYVKQIKDLAAAAVAVAAVGSIGVALCILVPPIARLFWQ